MCLIATVDPAHLPFMTLPNATSPIPMPEKTMSVLLTSGTAKSDLQHISLMVGWLFLV